MLDWLRDIYNAIIEFLVWLFSGAWLAEIIDWLLGYLPLPDGSAEAFVAPIALASQWFASFFAMFGYFVNVRFFFVAVAIALAVEFILAFPRVWKFILDMVPFA
jgi:hypothetical protein